MTAPPPDVDPLVGTWASLLQGWAATLTITKNNDYSGILHYQNARFPVANGRLLSQTLVALTLKQAILHHPP